MKLRRPAWTLAPHSRRVFRGCLDTMTLVAAGAMLGKELGLDGTLALVCLWVVVRVLLLWRFMTAGKPPNYERHRKG